MQKTLEFPYIVFKTHEITSEFPQIAIIIKVKNFAVPKCFKSWSHVIYEKCLENLYYSIFPNTWNINICRLYAIFIIKLNSEVEVINFNNFFNSFFVLLHLLMIFNTKNFLIKTIYSPFTSVDTFINVNLLYFCITQGMSKLIIQIFINTEFLIMFPW